MAKFQATISFEREDVNTHEEATAYLNELVSEEMTTTGELVTLVEVEIL